METPIEERRCRLFSACDRERLALVTSSSSLSAVLLYPYFSSSDDNPVEDDDTPMDALRCRLFGWGLDKFRKLGARSSTPLALYP